jgi:hypothetical protein
MRDKAIQYKARTSLLVGDYMNLAAWFLLLVCQNAAFTWVGRARNSGSLGYHATASAFSNGIFFASQFILISMVTDSSMPLDAKIGLGLVYISATVTGSVLMHWVSMKFLESGKRKVGA